MTSKLVRKILGTGLLVGSLVGAGGLISGCASVYETEPITRIFGSAQEVLPSWAQSAGWKEYKERNKQESMTYETVDLYDIETGKEIYKEIKGKVSSNDHWKESIMWIDRDKGKLKSGKEYRMDFYWSDYFELKGKKVKSVVIKID